MDNVGITSLNIVHHLAGYYISQPALLNDNENKKKDEKRSKRRVRQTPTLQISIAPMRVSLSRCQPSFTPQVETPLRSKRKN
jgi:hypothetical protein